MCFQDPSATLCAVIASGMLVAAALTGCDGDEVTSGAGGTTATGPGGAGATSEGGGSGDAASGGTGGDGGSGGAGGDAGGSTDPGPVNLAPFPDGWVTDTPWGIPVPDADYGVYHDEDTTHDGAYTIRVDPNAALAVGAFDYAFIAVAPGDRLFIKCWVRTAGASDGVFGARVWFDYYGVPSWGTGRIGGPDPFYSSGNVNGSGFVNWGTDWTQLIVDLIVPATVTADGQFDYTSGEPVSPTQVILWNQIWSDDYPASAYTGWFSDYEVYVNP